MTNSENQSDYSQLTNQVTHSSLMTFNIDVEAVSLDDAVSVYFLPARRHYHMQPSQQVFYSVMVSDFIMGRQHSMFVHDAFLRRH